MYFKNNFAVQQINDICALYIVLYLYYLSMCYTVILLHKNTLLKI